MIGFLLGVVAGICFGVSGLVWLERLGKRQSDPMRQPLPRHPLGDPIDFDDPADGVIVTRTGIEVRP